MAKIARIIVRGIRLTLAAAVLAWPTVGQAQNVSPAAPDASARSAPAASSLPAAQPQRSNFLGEVASKDARRVADWVAVSGDNAALPFIIIDKIRAKVFVFDRTGRLRGASLALLGTARGDDTVPGIGSRKLSAIRPEERTTPAGRFVAALGHDLQRDILWIDYNASVSLHRVITGNPNDHRLQRLATTSPFDKRITYGCVNVPVKFYESVVLETFTGTGGIVYILPETKTIEDVFAMSGGAAPAVGGGMPGNR
jgi:hypothetical protein